jgi:hypothetical protein
MNPTTTYRTSLENERVFNLIWSQMPEMQNRHSSSWWFFLLFPKGEEGYGPRQLMFTIATRMGRRIRVSDAWLPGLDQRRTIRDGIDRFHAISVGWYCDGQQVHKDFLKQVAPTVLSEPQEFIQCWADERAGQRIGCEFRASSDRDLTLEAIIEGQNGKAHFEAWGDLDSMDSSPHESMNIDTPLGGTHFIAWRRMNFAGDFDLPTGREHLEGICYFQRVCLNVPTFPWKWIWSLFPDGSMFSAYVPYVGLNLLRRGYKFFASNRLEQATLPIAGAGFWDMPGPGQRINFDHASVTPILGQDKYPQFDVQVSNKQGDALAFLAAPYGHTHLYIDRPVWGSQETHWSYNEYMFRMANLNGRIAGQPINAATMGQGFGNLEYSWGLGL